MQTDKVFRAAQLDHQAGRTATAEAGYRQALLSQPDHADALHFLGLLLAQSARSEEALPFLARASGLLPNRADIHTNHGEALRQAGHLESAEDCLRKAIDLAPMFPVAHYNLGNVLKSLGRNNEAIASFREAIRLKPNYARALYNLANTLLAEGRTAASIDFYRRALSAEPDWVDAHVNLANACFELREWDVAAEHYGRAANLKSDDPILLINLAKTYMSRGRLADAADTFRNALKRRPDDLTELRLAALTAPIPESNEAIDNYRSALVAKAAELSSRRLKIDVGELHSTGAEPPMVLTYQGRDDLPLKKQFAAFFGTALPRIEPPARRSAGPPRVGFVVTRGHEGVFARCLGELAVRLDARSLSAHIICSRSSADALRQLLPKPSVEYLLIPNQVDEAVTLIRSASFDLLYYWEIGTDSINYFLPYLAPARLQATGWGWPVTSAIPTVNWFVSAVELEPVDADAHYTERLVRLPSLPTYHLRPPVPAKPTERERFGVRGGEHLYLCQQNLRKLHPDFDSILADILRSDGLARIVLVADEQAWVTDLLLTRLRGAMPDVVNRLSVAARMDRVDYLGLVAAADVILDTLHYGGGANTVYDAAACGTPTVTLPGQFHRGRWAMAVNRNLGVDELNVSTPAQYAQVAVDVAKNLVRREDLSRRIRDRADGLFEDANAVVEFQEFLLAAVN